MVSVRCILTTTSDDYDAMNSTQSYIHNSGIHKSTNHAVRMNHSEATKNMRSNDVARVQDTTAAVYPQSLTHTGSQSTALQVHMRGQVFAKSVVTLLPPPIDI